VFLKERDKGFIVFFPGEVAFRGFHAVLQDWRRREAEGAEGAGQEVSRIIIFGSSSASADVRWFESVRALDYYVLALRAIHSLSLIDVFFRH
jgi:hypothetical protein